MTSPPALADLTRAELVPVALESMMLGHLLDRALMPSVAVHGTVDDVDDVAIDEWMGASPVYTGRMRRLMGIEGDDIAAIMKALQLDVGFVHQYMAVGYRVNDDRHGEFWLDHCGALMDVEPHGEDRVIGMCHHIEDPTFDATAYATNPRARIRPVHRPPRVPADRHPHCHWTIAIDPASEPVGPAKHTQRVASLPLATVPNEAPPDRESGGMPDYRGAFRPEFRLADLSQGALVAVAREFGVQCHLLTSSAELALTERFGRDTAREILVHQQVGAGWVCSERLAHALDVGGGGADALGAVLLLHPGLPPGFDRNLSVDGDRVRLELAPRAPGLVDPENPGWLGVFGRGEHAGIEAMAQAVEPRAAVTAFGAVPDDGFVVELAVDESADPAPEPPELAFMRLSTTLAWAFDTAPA
ncbi:MAG TPA: hypothetical protein VF152_09510 [Acidimicrobiia bacterium]